MSPMKPFLDERKCPAQAKICPAIPVCMEEAITFVADVSSCLGGRIVFDYDKCNGCEACVAACCGQAITMKE